MLTDLRALAGGLVAAALLPLGTASASEINPAGQWSFTADIAEGCTFTGLARLTGVSDNDGRYRGQLTARQSCDLLEEDFIVAQDCVASRVGKTQLSVRCTIREFLSGQPTPYYLPDNFVLTFDGPARMHGALVSSGAPKPAEWRRAESGVA